MTRFLSGTYTILGALLLASVASAATSADTVIRNSATATYKDLTTGNTATATSNKVETRVLPVCAVSLSSSGSSAAILPGEQTVLSYTLVNGSNFGAAFPLTTSLDNSGVAQVAVHLDANGNGVLDSGEQTVSSVTLAPGEQAALLVVATGTAAGSATVNLATTCTDGRGTTTISDTGKVEVKDTPSVDLAKTFTPTALRPKETSKVTLTASNSSLDDSREVVITDLLVEQRKKGLQFVTGSLKSSMSSSTLEYTADGTNWATAEPSEVLGVRVKVPKLAAKAQLVVTFTMRATEQADGQVFKNVATAITSDKTSTSTAELKVEYTPAVNLTPLKRPDAPEGSPADSQTIPTGVVGEEVCFQHLIKNTGDVKDSFDITVALPTAPADTSVKLKDKDGQPLTLPLTLDKNASKQVDICYTAKTTGSLVAKVTATGKRGSSNTTSDLVTKFEQGAPVLTKSILQVKNKNGEIQTDLEKAVERGSTVTYKLSVKNPFVRPLNNVVVTDKLQKILTYVSSSNSGNVSGDVGKQTVTWNLTTIPANSEVSLSVVAKINDDAKDGDIVKNTFLMVSKEFPKPRPSTTTELVVFDLGNIIIDKDVNPKVVSFGDRVTYTLSIPNNSTVADIIDSDVTDEPEKGLTYVLGSSTIEANGAPKTTFVDPVIDPKTGFMTWKVAKIEKGKRITIKYQMTVNTKADKELNNVVQIKGTVSGTSKRAIASNRAKAQAIIDPQRFAPLGDIVGKVFVDNNENGVFDRDKDAPVGRARVIMAGGRLALTDKEGRYSFANVPYGSHALRLDPNTIPYDPRKVAEDGGLKGTQTVHVRGLVAANFPLKPLDGVIDAVRRTSVQMGPLKLDKTVYRSSDNEYVVTLKLNTPNELSEFKLSDPLPKGAVLKQGQHTLNTTLPAGDTNLSYRFTWDGEIREATTDPAVSWRY